MRIPEIPTPVLSIGGDLFRMHLRGEISSSEHYAFNANWVEKNTYQYRELAFSVPSPTVSEYVRARLTARDYDYNRAGNLGSWFNECIKIQSENEANRALLLWSKEKLAALGIATPKIDAALEHASELRNHDAFYFEAMEVKRMDSDVSLSRKRRGE